MKIHFEMEITQEEIAIFMGPSLSMAGTEARREDNLQEKARWAEERLKRQEKVKE